MTFTTFEDVVDHGYDYLGGNPSDNARRDCVRAATEAYRDLANAHTWSYLYTQGRFYTSAAFAGADGATIAYRHTGGAYERMVTLSGDVWPDWASDGYLRVGQVAYRVDERKSATVLTLSDTLNPGDDIASGTPFTLYRDTYLLPEDYIAQDQALHEGNFGGMAFSHPKDWLYENRFVIASGLPEFYAITGDPKYPGRLVIRVYPWPVEVKSIDYLYKRRPRALRTILEARGKVTITSGSTTLNGTGTVFSPILVGSVVRLSANGIKPPTSLIKGDNPAAFESVVKTFVSPTQVVLQDPADQAYSSVMYTASDPIDIEQGAMLNAYLRCVEKHLGMNRTLKDKPSAANQFRDALAEAKSADSRSFAGRSVGLNVPMRRRLRDYPYNPNVVE